MKALNAFLTGIGWAAFVILALFGLVALPTVSAFLLFLAAVICLPVKQVKNLVKKILPSRVLRVIVVAVLFVIGMILFPTDDTTEQPEIDSVVTETTVESTDFLEKNTLEAEETTESTGKPKQKEPGAMIFLAIILAAILVYLLPRYSKIKKEYTKILNPQEEIERLNSEIKQLEHKITEAKHEIAAKDREVDDLTDTALRIEREIETKQKKLQTIKSLHEAVTYSIQNLSFLSKDQAALYDDLCPSIKLRINAMDSKELQKEYKANQKLIDDLVKESAARFDERYSSRAISAVYMLTVIAMQAEVQNILHTIKYEELEKAESAVRDIAKKYYSLAADATRTITGALSGIFAKGGKGPTIDESLRKNITELEYLFLCSVRIEYNYYVKKEQAKAEQAALREQMRIEAAEKKALEAERQKIESEEAKYQSEISKLADTLSSSSSDEEKAKLEARISELQNKLAAVTDKKEEIIHLQNGKAGTVYVISNLGAFGEDVFKVGMTRRLNPQDRVDELGDASVPFRFDVHSFIFSEDAVALETKLHTILAERRVNKINRRKEFFRIPMEELRSLVYEADPTATFSTTMAAEEYRQSMSLEE